MNNNTAKTNLTSPKHDELKSLKLLSYNIFIRPPGINNNGNDYKSDRIGLIADRMRKYDVVCFQEMFSQLSTRRQQIVKKLQDFGLSYANYPDGPSPLALTLIGSGLMTASRLPIIGRAFSPFQDGAGVDRLAQKGVQYSKIMLGGGRYLHLFNLHLQASYTLEFTPQQIFHFQARLNQIASLRIQIDTILQENSNFRKLGKTFTDPIIVLGDFNVNSNGQKLPPVFELDSPLAAEWIYTQRGSTFSEYDFLVSCLSDFGTDTIVDLKGKNGDGTHPITFGDSLINANGVESPTETILTAKYDLCSRKSIDYAFQLLPEHKECPGFKASCKVEPFFLKEGEHDVLTQLSDHYGLEIDIMFNENI